jgi:hypothetical protein
MKAPKLTGQSPEKTGPVAALNLLRPMHPRRWLSPVRPIICHGSLNLARDGPVNLVPVEVLVAVPVVVLEAATGSGEAFGALARTSTATWILRRQSDMGTHIYASVWLCGFN